MLTIDSSRLVRLLIERGLSCLQLAQMCGVTSARIAQYCRGDPRIRFKTIKALADALNVDFSAFVKGSF